MNFNNEAQQVFPSSKVLNYSNYISNLESSHRLNGENDSFSLQQNWNLQSKRNNNNNNNYLSLYPKNTYVNNDEYERIAANKKRFKNTSVSYNNPIRISNKNLFHQLHHHIPKKANLYKNKLTLGEHLRRRNSYQVYIEKKHTEKKNLKQIQIELQHKLLDMSIQIENEDNSLEEGNSILSNFKNGINQEVKLRRKENKRNTYYPQNKNKMHILNKNSFKKNQTGFIKLHNNINSNSQNKEIKNETIIKKESQDNQNQEKTVLKRRKSFIPQRSVSNKLENNNEENRLNLSVNMNLYRDLIPNINMNIAKEELSTINNKSMLISKKNINIKKILLNSIKNEQFENKYRLLFRQKELYDSYEDEEVIEELEDEYLFINPETYQILIFDTLILIFTLFGSFYFPIFIAQSKCYCSYMPKAIEWVSFFLDAINIIDIGISFFRAYYNFEFILVKKNKKIIIHYFKKYFFYDVLSAIPFFTISYYFCNKYKYKPDGDICFYNGIDLKYNFLKMALGLKIVKLLKVLDKKANKGINYFYEIISENYTLEKTMKMLLFITMCAMGFNFFICYHIYIGQQSYPNWILKTDNQDASFTTLYITSFYFLITTITSVGYGDITCVSLSETLYQIVILTIGVIAYSWIVSTIGNYVKKETRAAIKFNKDISLLEEIRVSYPKMGFKLYNKIHKHLETVSHQQEKLDTNLLVTNLPYTLKNQIMFIIYGSIIKKFKFFKECENSDFILRVLTSFIPLSTKKGAFIIQEGEIVDNIVFVKEGRLSLMAAIDLDNPLSSIESYLGVKFEDINEKMSTELDNSLMDRSINNVELRIDKAKTVLKTFLKTKGDIEEENIEQEIAKKDYEGEDYELGNIQYLNILDILKNEHYGIVYMFLKKPAPLSLRVKSKYSQLFLLRKNDTMQISRAYPNVWKKIYHKSYHNMKSIKKLTKKIIINYCYNYGHKLENVSDTGSIKKDEIDFLLGLGILNSRKRTKKTGFNFDGNNTGNKPKSILKKNESNKTLGANDRTLYGYKSFKTGNYMANYKMFGTQMNSLRLTQNNKANTNINKNISFFTSKNKLSSLGNDEQREKYHNTKISQINQINNNINYNIVINGIDNKNDDSKTLLKTEESKSNKINNHLVDKKGLSFMQHIPSKIRKENSLSNSVTMNNNNTISKNNLIFNKDRITNPAITKVVTLKVPNLPNPISRSNTVLMHDLMEKSDKSPNTINNLSKTLLKKVKKKIKKQRKKKKMYKMLIQKISEALIKVNPNVNLSSSINNNSIILSSKIGDMQIPLEHQLHDIIEEKPELNQDQYHIPIPHPHELLIIPETLEIPSSEESSENSDDSSNTEKNEESNNNEEKTTLAEQKEKEKKWENLSICQSTNFSFNTTYENLNKISEGNYSKDENLQKSVIKLIKVYLNEKNKTASELNKNKVNETNSKDKIKSKSSNSLSPKNKENNSKDLLVKQKVKKEKEKDVWSFLEDHEDSKYNFDFDESKDGFEERMCKSPQNIRHKKTSNDVAKRKKSRKGYSNIFSLVDPPTPKNNKKNNYNKKKSRKSTMKSTTKKEIEKKKTKKKPSLSQDKPILQLHNLNDEEDEKENKDDKKENKENMISSLELSDIDENDKRESYLKNYYKTYQKKRKKQDDKYNNNDK